MNKRDGGRV